MEPKHNVETKLDELNSTKFRFSLKPIKIGLHPFEIFSKLYHSFKYAFIFESVSGPEELSEISIIGFDPYVVLTCNIKTLEFKDSNGNLIKKEKVIEPLSQIRNIIPKIKNNDFRYIGGAVGYISYEAINFWENIIKKKSIKSRFPIMDFGIYLDGIIYDHKVKKSFYFSISQKHSRFKSIQQLLQTVSNQQTIKTKEKKIKISKPISNLTKTDFTKIVNKAKKYIFDGDIFQVVLSRKFQFDIEGDFLDIYSKLRLINPSPYMYFLKSNQNIIIGTSPEMLARVSQNNIETFPIAGTRPIVEDESINKKLRNDLLNDEKEIAEHTMLVDLARNDIGRICRLGTVKVKELMKVKRFSHVQHIVSHVIGDLDDKKYDSFDVIKAVFPAGTVSGAPKIRAMEIIKELEPECRGPYAGAIGYFSFNGSSDFAIAIRTIFIHKNRAYVQAGAGIVMDSIPEREWDETTHKANVIFSALDELK